MFFWASVSPVSFMVTQHDTASLGAAFCKAVAGGRGRRLGKKSSSHTHSTRALQPAGLGTGPQEVGLGSSASAMSLCGGHGGAWPCLGRLLKPQPQVIRLGPENTPCSAGLPESS